MKRLILIGLIICLLPMMVSGNFTTEGSLTGLVRLSPIVYPPHIYLPGMHFSQYSFTVSNNNRIKPEKSLVYPEKFLLENTSDVLLSVSCYWGSASSLQVYCGSSPGSKEIDLGCFTQSEVKSEGELRATLEAGNYYITVVNNSSGNVIVDELTVDVRERPVVNEDFVYEVRMPDDYEF